MTWSTTPPQGRKFAIIETSDDAGFDVAQWDPRWSLWTDSNGWNHPPDTPWHPLPYREGVSRKTHEMVEAIAKHLEHTGLRPSADAIRARFLTKDK